VISGAVTWDYLSDGAYFHVRDGDDVAEFLVDYSFVLCFYLLASDCFEWFAEGFRRDANSVFASDKFEQGL